MFGFRSKSTEELYLKSNNITIIFAKRNSIFDLPINLQRINVQVFQHFTAIFCPQHRWAALFNYKGCRWRVWCVLKWWQFDDYCVWFVTLSLPVNLQFFYKAYFNLVIETFVSLHPRQKITCKPKSSIFLFFCQK